MATKLNKTQAQAIINKLGREYNSLRNTLIAEDKQNYTPSANAVKLSKLIQKKDKLKAVYSEAIEAARKFAESVGIHNIYDYNGEDVIHRLKILEIEDKYPRINLDAALDDLIISSIEDDFNVDNFIEQHLRKIKNG
nr:MAG TPA: hypothetical protein [Bacteriophage sp.]